MYWPQGDETNMLSFQTHSLLVLLLLFVFSEKGATLYGQNIRLRPALEGKKKVFLNVMVSNLT